MEKIFIENRIYRDIEECETWEAVIETIDKGLDPFKPQFYREITEDDVVRLTEIKIKRISRFDSFKADELMKRLAEDLEETEHNLENITEYTINYYENILKKYGKGRERKTELKSFETIDTTMVVANNQKLFVNRLDGFIGWGLKKDEFIQECSDIDDVIVIRKDGKCVVSRIADKVFMGKDILHVGVWKKGDDRRVYNMIYLDGKSGRSMVKRFNVTAVTRDKEYDVVKKHANSRVLYLSANPNGEAEIVTVKLTSSSSARKKIFDFDFSEIDIKGKGAGGNILTKYPVRRVDLKEEGSSTLSGLDIWYDRSIGKLNRDHVGDYVGNFNADDNIIVFYKDGSYELTSYELTNKYDASKIEIIEKFETKNIYTAIHFDGKSKNYYVKRFLIETSTIDKKFEFISEEKGSKLSFISSAKNPMVELEIRKKKGDDKEKEVIDLSSVIDVKGWKAVGNKLSSYQVYKIKSVNPVKEDKISEYDSGNKKIETQDEEHENVKKVDKSKNIEQLKTADAKEDISEGKRESVDEEKKPVEKLKPDFSPRKNPKDDGFKPGDTIQLDF